MNLGRKSVNGTSARVHGDSARDVPRWLTACLEFVTAIWLFDIQSIARRRNKWLSQERKKESMPLCKAGRGSHPNRIALEVQNTAWGDERSATCTATAWWTSPSRRKSAMSWLQLVAPNPTTSFPTVAGSVFI